MTKLRKAARRAAGRGRAWLAALAAAALVAGMAPAAALAQAGAADERGGGLAERARSRGRVLRPL